MHSNLSKILISALGFIVLVLYFCAVFEYVPPHNYKTDLGMFEKYEPASSRHWLGTDSVGIDTFTLIVYGLKTAILSGALAAIPFLIVGILLGLSAGYGEGKLSTFANRVIETLNMVPNMLFLLLAISFMAINTYFILFLFGALTAPKLAELLKRKVISMKSEVFIESAIALGVTRRKILFVHILWYNCKDLLLLQLIYIFNLGVMMETSLSYIGLGFGASVVNWGFMIYKAIGTTHLLQLVAPVTALTIFIYSLYFISNMLKKKLGNESA
jgi:ABC-type dipeptide/oligopeptide/nickel transport system permease subunit